MSKRVFGHIIGYPEDSIFENREELSESRVHVPRQAGISGSQTEGAESIVLSGGYEDDTDYGDTIIYTGHEAGMQSPASRVTISLLPVVTGLLHSAN